MNIDAAIAELRTVAARSGRTIDEARARRDLRRRVSDFVHDRTRRAQHVSDATRSKKYLDLLQTIRRAREQYDELRHIPNLIDPLISVLGGDWESAEFNVIKFCDRLAVQEAWLSAAQKASQSTPPERPPGEAASPTSRRKGGRPKEADRRRFIIGLGITYRSHTGQNPGYSENGPFVRFVKAACKGEIEFHVSANLDEFVKATLRWARHDAEFSFEDFAAQDEEMDRYSRHCGVVEN